MDDCRNDTDHLKVKRKEQRNTNEQILNMLGDCVTKDVHTADRDCQPERLHLYCRASPAVLHLKCKMQVKQVRYD